MRQKLELVWWKNAVRKFLGIEIRFVFGGADKKQFIAPKIFLVIFKKNPYKSRISCESS
jgi:hypothetical protein